MNEEQGNIYKVKKRGGKRNDLLANCASGQLTLC